MRRVWWLLWRVGVVLLVGAWALSGGPLAAVCGWAVLAYLLWRAGPSVGRDARWVGARFARRVNAGRGQSGGLL